MKPIRDASVRWPEHSVGSPDPAFKSFAEGRKLKKEKGKPQTYRLAMLLNELTAEVI